MCMDPPLARQLPVVRPNSSAIMRSIGAPFARQCPWLRWVPST